MGNRKEMKKLPFTFAKILTMRNMLILLIITNLLLSCSSDDDNSGNSQSNDFFNPPSWIQGKWLVDDSNMEFGFEFTSNNFIIINSISSSIDYGEILQMQNDLGISTNVTEEISDSEYKIRINLQGANTTYTFRKVNLTTIEYSNTNFYKQ